MSLSTVQLARLRRDLGDAAGSFTDHELEDNWLRVAGAADEITRHDATMGLCFRQLLNGAAKLHDYSAGAVDEKLNQIVRNLEKRYEDYRPALEAALGHKKQVVISKLGKRTHPTRRQW
jgi:hypothetical protein